MVFALHGCAGQVFKIGLRKVNGKFHIFNPQPLINSLHEHVLVNDRSCHILEVLREQQYGETNCVGDNAANVLQNQAQTRAIPCLYQLS
jgi:hypothetical protein